MGIMLKGGPSFGVETKNAKLKRLFLNVVMSS